MSCVSKKGDKVSDKIAVRSDLDVKSSEELKDILEWLGNDVVTGGIKFCIRQVWLSLEKKNWKSILDD